MKKLFILLTQLILLSNLYAQEKKICFTVDDLPTVNYGITKDNFKLKITEQLVQAFAEKQVPAIGYVNEKKLYTEDGTLDSTQVYLLELWLKNGLDLGNHTFSHPNYHRVSYASYTADILKGERVTKDLVKKYQSELKYFRHPYLRSGQNKERADSLQSFLTQNGYIEAPVTVDNEDYLFALAYSRAFNRGDQELMEKIGADYLQYMEEKLLFFENQSQKLFGRNIAQILLIHASYLNANYADELINMCESHGYIFVSQEEVLKDPAYKEQVTKFGDWGISWLDRWALSKGKKGDFFKEEPRTPTYIAELAK